MKKLRKENAFLLVRPHLEKQGLPIKDLDYLLDPINVEYALLCLEEETFNEVFNPEISLIGNKAITKDNQINKLEELFAQGAETVNMLEALEKEFGLSKSE